MKATIPAQKEGVAFDTISEETLPTEKQAKAHFQLVKQRLLAVNFWHEVIDTEKLIFSLVDSRGEKKERLPAVGDFIRIEIPGPLNQEGDGFDWVRIEDIVEDEEVHEEFISIRVRPSVNPLKNDSETAHFFDDSSTSTFIVKRRETKLKAEIHGRNEKPNIEDLGLIDKVRNTFVAFGGTLGASKIFWKSLADGLLA